MHESKTNWLVIGGESADGIAAELASIVRNRLARGEFLERDVEYITKLSRPVISKPLCVSPERLEKIRTLCQLWDIDIRSAKITSHRKVIGPIIVAVKRALLPILKMLLKDTVNQQRDFNAAAISLLTDMANEIDRKR